MLVLICVIVILGLAQRWYSRRKLPPGPPSVPILGCLPFTNWDLKFVKVLLHPDYYKYGKVVRFDYGFLSIYILNDYDLTKKLFNMDACSSRLHVYDKARSIHCKPKVARGIGVNFGHSWTTQRRFAMRSLREFGYGRKTLELIIQEEAEEAIEGMLEESQRNGEILIENNFNLPVLNVLWQIISSKRLNYEDKNAAQGIHFINQIFQSGFDGLFLSFPILAKILPPRFYAKSMLNVWDVVRKEILEHEKVFDPNSPPKDFIDAYLHEIEKGEDEDFFREQLVCVCFDFFAAGSETTSTFLKWCVLYMTLHQDVQKKCQEEIDSFLGDKLADKEDQNKLIYCNATIQEIFRSAQVAPGSLLHRTTEDIPFEKYVIPKGSVLACNLVKFSMDPETFPNPTQFDPTRFIENGKIKTYKELAPFGVGKRICMGENLGRTSGFIFFVTMMQKMKISPAKGRPQVDPQNFIRNMTTIPNPFYVKLERRCSNV